MRRTKTLRRTHAQAHAFNVPMTASGAYRGMTLGSCNMLNSSVMSWPVYNSLQDCLLSSGVVRKELCHVEHLSVDDHPDVVLLVVLRDLLCGKQLSSCVLGPEDECALVASAAFVEVSSEAAAEAGVEDEGAEDEAVAGEEDEDAPSHEKSG